MEWVECHRDLGVQKEEDSMVGVEKVQRIASAPSQGDVRGHGDVHGAREGMQDVQERDGGRKEDRRQPKDAKRWDGKSAREETSG